MTHLRHTFLAFFALVAFHESCGAHVMPAASASFVVSVQVAASCDIETGAGVALSTPQVSCSGSELARIEDVAASALSHPTDAEKTVADDAKAVSIVY